MCACQEAERRKILNGSKITEGCNIRLWMKKCYKERKKEGNVKREISNNNAEDRTERKISEKMTAGNRVH